jgi:hypothetical protein
MHALLAGTALVVLTNAVVLHDAHTNRSGEPDARITLTERERRLEQDMGLDEDSRLALRLDWRRASDDPGFDGTGGHTRTHWLDAARMSELGFDTCTSDGTDASRFARGLPRHALVVLEYDGPAWQRRPARAQDAADAAAAAAAAHPRDPRLAREAEWAAVEARRERVSNRRLFAVDAGSDVRALRARYADRTRHLILSGTVRPVADKAADGSCQCGGIVSEIAVDRLNVPHALRDGLDRIQGAQHSHHVDGPPRYAVVLSIGQRLEPWLQQVSLLPAEPASMP